MHIPLWLILALISPFANALVNVVDVYFAKGVYENEWDGAAISCMFKIVALPILLVWVTWQGEFQLVLSQFSEIDKNLFELAFIGGFFYSLSNYFYFRAVMSGKADVVFIEALFNLTAVFVPVLAVLVLGKVLTVYQWIGVVLAFIGAFVLYVRGQDLSMEKFIGKKTMSKILASICLSICIIIENKVYEDAPFIPIFCVFSCGCFTIGCSYVIVRKMKKMQSLTALCRRFFFIFIIMETLEFLGALSQELALSMTESYYVSTIYCFQPVFVLVISGAMLVIFSTIALFPRKLWNLQAKLNGLVEEVHADQVGRIWAKFFGITAIIIAVMMVSF